MSGVAAAPEGAERARRYVNVFTDRRLEVNCPTHDALAAGGPWLRDFDTNSRIGFVNGVNGQRTSSGWHRSSYFNSEIAAVYQYADRCRPTCS